MVISIESMRARRAVEDCRLGVKAAAGHVDAE